MNEPNIINNIPNTKVSFVKDESGFSPTYTFTVNADAGVKIKKTPAPTVTYEDAIWGEDTKNLTVSEDGKTAKSEALEIDTASAPNVTFNGEIEGGTPVPTANVINNIAGTKETHTIKENTLDITVTGDSSSRWFFDVKATYIDIDGNQKVKDMVVNENSTVTAKVTLTDVDLSKPVTLTGTYEIGYSILNQTENCIVSGLEPYYKKGGKVDITLTANVGFAFEDANKPKISFSSAFEDYSVESTLDGERKTAHITWEMKGDSGIYTLTGKAVEEAAPPVGGKYGAINVYVVTDENLNELSKQRFIETSGDSYNAIDIGKYINRIKRIYSAIEVSGDTTLSLGNYNTSISVKTPMKEIITLDFGKLTVPAPNGDLTDYESGFNLFLPFKGFVPLSVNYAGEEISLQYVINIITGDGVAKISCNDIVFQIEEITPSTDVIYRTLEQDIRTVGNDGWKDFVLYGIEPYLHVTYHKTKSSERNIDNIRVKLGDISGFVSVTDVTPLNAGEMLTEEQEMIYSALYNGVYM